MFTRASVALGALIAALALSLAASSAMAQRSIEVRTPEGGGGLTAEGRLSFATSFELSPETQIACEVTLLMTMARSFSKVSGSQMGRITGIKIDQGEARASHCRGAAVETIVFLAERERAARSTEDGRGRILWDLVSGARAELGTLTYDGFLGLLPEITNIRFHIHGVQLQITRFVMTCLYRGDAGGRFNVARRVITGMTIDLENSILPRDSGSVFCLSSLAILGGFTTPRATIALL